MLRLAAAPGGLRIGLADLARGLALEASHACRVRVPRPRIRRVGNNVHVCAPPRRTRAAVLSAQLRDSPESHSGLLAPCPAGYIGEFEIVDDHRAGKVVVQLIGRVNKCGVISPRFDVTLPEVEKWVNNLLPSRQFGCAPALAAGRVTAARSPSRARSSLPASCAPSPPATVPVPAPSRRE